MPARELQITRPMQVTEHNQPNRQRRKLLKLPLIAAVPYIANARESVDPLAIASMLLVGFLGDDESSQSAQSLARDIEKNRVGGVCFLGHNARSRNGIENLTKLFHSATQKITPLVAIDQEGGAVQRLGKRSGYAALPRAQTVATQKSPAEAIVLYRELALGLKHAGFNLNLAPVVDLGVEPNNPVVYRWGRTFGDQPGHVSKFAAAFIQAHQQSGVATALKHFPGHGSTLIDSHAAPVDLTHTWTDIELDPFRQLVQQGMADVIMSGHLSHQDLTGGLPATLSPQAVTLIRTNLGFDGVVMTDDLDMKAIRSSYSLIDAVIRAIAAGNDLILLSNSLDPDPTLPRRIIAAVKDAVKDGSLSANLIHKSAERLHKLKQLRGLA